MVSTRARSWADPRERGVDSQQGGSGMNPEQTEMGQSM